MKFIKISIALIISMIFLQGCNGNEAVSPPPENLPTEQDEDIVTDQLDPTDVGENDGGYMFDFTSFDLDVEYAGNKSFDVEFENDAQGMEAKVEDDLSNETYHGNEAFAVIFPVLEDLSLNKSMPKEDVITKVITLFNLSNDFNKFELEVEFTDGTKKEYHATRKSSENT